MPIPIDLSNASISPTTQQRTSPSYPKRSVHDVPSMTTTTRPSAAPSSDLSVNELRVNLSSPSANQQQKKVSIQLDEKTPQQRSTKLIFPPIITTNQS
jgi:hypothetical protein